MDSIRPLATAIDYLESRLTEPVAVNSMAEEVGYSRSHFDRCFSYIVGYTPAQYLRKRRLSEAARELAASNRPIIEIALDYQFQSQEAFTRAFKKEFRLTPLAYRKKGRLMRLTPKVTLRTLRIYRLDLTKQHPHIEFVSIYRLYFHNTTFVAAAALPILR